MTHVEPRCVHALNEATFLVTYPLGILAEDIGSAIEKINEWFGKPVVITCNEVAATQLPQFLECACHTTGVESIGDSMRYELSPSPVYVVDTEAMQVAQLCWVHLVPLFFSKISGIPQFSGSELEKDTVRF